MLETQGIVSLVIDVSVFHKALISTNICNEWNNISIYFSLLLNQFIFVALEL